MALLLVAGTAYLAYVNQQDPKYELDPSIELEGKTAVEFCLSNKHSV
jgi:hypothetical protein